MSRGIPFGSLTAFAAAAAMAMVAPAAAQEVTAPVAADTIASRPYTPGRFPGGRISLGDAVGLTLRHQPRLVLAGQDVQAAAGRVRETRGLFDPIFRIAPSLDYTQQPINPGFLKSQRDNRTLILAVARQFTELNVALRDILANSSNPLPRCPLDVNFGTEGFVLDVFRPEEVSLIGLPQDQFPVVNVDLQNALGGRSLSDFCTSPIGDSPLDAIQFELTYGRINEIDQGQEFGLAGVLRSGLEAPRESIALLTEISEAVAARARLALERLGPLPADQFTRTFSLQTSIAKPFRNGITASLDLLLQSEESNFRDKILDPTFGGAGVPVRFPSNLTLGLNVPLGKGRGSASVAAAERSARFTLNAATEQARHTASEEVYRTLLAYLNLVGAQENLRMLEGSAARLKDLVSLVEGLVSGGEAAEVDLARARARAAAVQASIAGARAAVAEARVSLAEAAGLEVSTIAEAPLASDRFAEVRTDEVSVEALIAAAQQGRRDRIALDHARRAAAEITRGAQADLRRRFDVSIRTGLANSRESELFRFLIDERQPIFSELNPPQTFNDPNRYYEPAGFWNSLSGRWEPFIIAAVSFDLPFGNNTAKGRLAQAQATLRSADIQYADRNRLIGDNIVGVTGSLRAAAEGVRRAREAVERGKASVEGVVTQLRAGEATLIDTLTTEEELTRDELELVRQQQLYFSTLARLRFESGQLVDFSGIGGPGESIRFNPAEFVVR